MLQAVTARDTAVNHNLIPSGVELYSMEQGKPNFLLVYNKIVYIMIDEAYEEQMEPPRVIRRPRRLQ